MGQYNQIKIWEGEKNVKQEFYIQQNYPTKTTKGENYTFPKSLLQSHPIKKY